MRVGWKTTVEVYHNTHVSAGGHPAPRPVFWASSHQEPEGSLPSPVAHSLVGLAIAHTLAPTSVRARSAWYAVAVVAANAADLDFLAGLAAGSINAFHGGATHSFAVALAFGGLTALVFRPAGTTRGRVALAAFASYASHVILDMACNQDPRNAGMTVLWPLTNERWLFAWRPLPGIIHGGTGGGIPQFLGELFSVHNLMAGALELAVFLPLLGLVLWVRGDRNPFRRSA